MSYYSNRGGGGGGRGRGGGGGRGGGRGEYYKNKYGGGSASSGGNNRPSEAHYEGGMNSNTATAGGTYAELRNKLGQLDGRSYPAYHDLETSTLLRGYPGWLHSIGFTLQIGRTQSDPFAPPTRCRILLPPSLVQLPVSLVNDRIGCMATADFLWRRFYKACRNAGAHQSMDGQGWSGPKGGDLGVMEPTQNVCEQSAVQIKDGAVLVHATINLPARGRSILGYAAMSILDEKLSHIIDESLLRIDHQSLNQHVTSVRDQLHVQNLLERLGLVAFVRNGAILPRRSGVDDRPMESNAILFQSPPGLEIEIDLPHSGTKIKGMGIPNGVTLICGGGFHGKSTVLEALQAGVYPKIPGDGREFCVTKPTAVKIRSEDGRSITDVDISTFIRNLPFGKDTVCFGTADASGSTSQACNIIESIELGASTLLMDEDTSATNFMIRDSKMMQLVATEKEPITPFVSVVRSLYERTNVSTILVVGGSGDYFHVADHVLLMDCYRCEDATARAKEILQKDPMNPPPTALFQLGKERFAIPQSLAPNGKVKVNSHNSISYGEDEILLGGMEQIISKGQTNAIAASLCTLSSQQQSLPLKELLEMLNNAIDDGGLDTLAPGQFHGQMIRPRVLEVGGSINRLRRPCVRQGK